VNFPRLFEQVSKVKTLFITLRAICLFHCVDICTNVHTAMEGQTVSALTLIEN
jgi:hypothetical protein